MVVGKCDISYVLPYIILTTVMFIIFNETNNKSYIVSEMIGHNNKKAVNHAHKTLLNAMSLFAAH